jgi:hypothetical protein
MKHLVALVVAVSSAGGKEVVLPSWTAAIPDPDNKPAAGLPIPKGVEHFTVYSASNTTWGAYNHGPIITQANGTFFMSWYNGVMDESVANRALFATSTDAEHWSEPAVLIKSTAGYHHNKTNHSVGYAKGYNIGIENEAWVLTPEGRLYGMAASWDVFQRRGHGSEHVGPDAALLRRVHLPSDAKGAGDAELGEVFWLADTVPEGFDTYCNLTYNDMESVTAADAANFRSRLVSTVPDVDAGEPNERSMHSLASSTSSDGAVDLVSGSLFY